MGNQSILDTIAGYLLRFRIWLTEGEKGTDVAREMNKAWDEAWKVMKDKVPLVKAIEAEFRELLGVLPGARVQGD